MTDLGEMGTATADSLREVGLDPAPAADHHPREHVRSREQVNPPAPPPLASWPRQLLAGLAFAGVGTFLICGVGSFVSSERADLREIEHQTKGYLQALYEMEHVTELRIRASEERERDLRAAIRRIEEYQARAVRAERRARRLGRKEP